MGAAGMGIPSAYAIGCADLNEVLLETPDPGFGKEARWGQRAPPERPVIFVRTQSLRHRIQPDILPGFLLLLIIADSVIEIVGLPCNAMQTCHASLPVADYGRHAGFTRKDQA